MTYDSTAVAIQLKEERQRRRLDQHTLADMVGVQRTSITNIENGRQALSLSLFCKIANALEKHPAELLREALNREPEMDVQDFEVPEADIRHQINKTLRSGS